MEEFTIPLPNLIGVYTIAGIFSILSTLAGIGGGAIFIPLYILIGGIEVKAAIFLALVTMVGNSIGRVVYYFFKKHHETNDRFLPDYNIIRLFVPFNGNATYIGFLLNQLLPGWAILILIIMLMVIIIMKTALSLVQFCKEGDEEPGAIEMGYGNDERINRGSIEFKKTNIYGDQLSSDDELDRELRLDRDELIIGQTWRDLLDEMLYIILAIGLVTLCSYVREGLDEYSTLIYVTQFVIMILFGYMTMQHIKIQDRWRKDNYFRTVSNDLNWSDWWVHRKIAMMSSITGICSALLGIGGGLIMNPFMLHLGVHPKVILATSGWTTFFSVVLSTVQYLAQDSGLLDQIHGVIFIVGLLGSGLGLFLLRYINKNAKVVITSILLFTMILCAGLLIVINVIRLSNQ